ncbi:MAG: N-acetylglucosamine-6-phosphate deacetylase [Gammaproteobacteria bacterium]|nr:MAG: N-acetylglucosamine-6-phosphate deacetylase [Gammaproteobacteria bacterium]
MSEVKRCIISGAPIMSERKWVKDHAIVMEEGIIKALIPADMAKHHLPAKHYEFPADHCVIPGFIDLHVHGTHGYDVMDGTEEALLAMSQALAAEGITGFLATTMTSDDERLEHALQTIAKTTIHQEKGAAVLGAHLEGPFIAPSKLGAHASDEVRLPDSELIKHWQAVANGHIKIVTLAPELPHALSLIKQLNNMDIIASIGHTNATYEETCTAIAAGCTQATHLFNAMRGIHQREPGAVSALLLSDKIAAEIIVDGLHLHPAIIDLALRVKGRERILLVTDAMRAKCLGNGRYELGGQLVNVDAGKATLEDGTLAGSTLRMPQAVKNMADFTKCSLIDAISMASSNAAKVLKMDTRKGDIAIGKDADVVVLSPDFDVLLTLRAGKEIYKAQHG